MGKKVGLVIQEDYKASLTTFLELLTFKSWTSMMHEDISSRFRELYGTDVVSSDFLSKSEEVFSECWYFVLRRDEWNIDNFGLLKENIKTYTSKIQNTIDEIKEIHNNKWEELSKTREQFVSMLEDTREKYWGDIKALVEEFTNIDWSVDEIILNPVLSVNNRSIENRILLSFSPVMQKEKWIIRFLIGETLHVNKKEIWKEYRDSGDPILFSANEICSEIITSEITKRIKKKYDKNMDVPSLHRYHGGEIQEKEGEFKDLLDSSSDFEEFLLNVKDVLQKIGYESPFQEMKDYGKIFEERNGS